MSPASRAIVLRPRDPPSPRVIAAELRLAGLLREVAVREAEVEGLAHELAVFEARYLDATSQAFAELDRAERLVRRVRRAVDEAERLRRLLLRGPPAAPHRRSTPAAAARRAAPGPSLPREGRVAKDGRDSPPGPAVEGATLDASDPDLKALYRQLARALHPDLARGDEAERARRSELMARANDSYRRGDRTALELLAERVGAFGGGAGVSEAELLVHLARRIAAVETARERLSARHAQLAGSQAARLRDQAMRRARGDLLVEARAAAEEEARAAREEALELLGKLPASVRALAAARRATLESRASGAGGPARRVWDPASESLLVRREPARRGHRRRSSAAARVLTRALENRAGGAAPWEAALTLIAFLGEVAGCPQEPLADPEVLAERWEALRAAWPGAPDLGRSLAMMPGHLEIGLRLAGQGVEAGLQLASADLATGVRAALDRPATRALAQQVVAALGPRERCGACHAEVYAVHLLRVRGLEEVHGLACPRCARTLRTFLRYGEPEGVEALSGLAVEIGLVAEQAVRFAGARLAFQMLPAERGRLTGRALLGRFRELCLEPHGLHLPRGALGLRVRRAWLAPGARVPEGASASVVVLPGAGIDARELLGLVREKIGRRFRA